MKKSLQHPIAVLGLPLNNLTAENTVDSIEKLILSGGHHQVATANLDFWVNSLADQHLHRIIAGCSLVIPDGMPLVWTSRLMGTPLAERVAGVDLVPSLVQLSARKGYRIFFLGGRDGVAERARTVLEQKYPGAQIVGCYAPTKEEVAQTNNGAILDQIHAARPDILMVAFGNPKQEKWIWAHRKQLKVPVTIGVGGSFDMIVGDLKRAPRWMQRSGLEWFGRCLQEPSRLAPRYYRNFTGLARRLPLALAASWSQSPHRGLSTVTTARDSSVMHVFIHGKLTRETIPNLQRAVSSSIENGLHMVVNLKSVKQVDSEGLGYLMEARRLLLEAGLPLSLGGVNLKQRFLLHAWCAERLFDTWRAGRSQDVQLAYEAEAAAYINLTSKQQAIPAQANG